MAVFSDYILHIAYTAQAIGHTISVICSLNGLMFFAILRDKSLNKRKELQIIAALAASDFIFGFGSLGVAVDRIYLLANDFHNHSSTMFLCAVFPPSFCQHVGFQLTTIMNVVVSCDRLAAVSKPTAYLASNGGYTGTVLAAVAAYTTGTLLAMILSAHIESPSASGFTRMCQQSPFPRWYALYEYTFVAVVGFIGVLIYICVYYTYRRSVKKVASSTTVIDLRDMAHTKQQHRLTVTLGIIAFSTFCLSVVPFSIITVATLYHVEQYVGRPMTVLQRFSTIINVIIYVIRQHDVRTGMLKLVGLKDNQSPNNLNHSPRQVRK